MFHDVQQNQTHYDRVTTERPPLWYQRFDGELLERNPRVRRSIETLLEQRFEGPVGRMLDLGCGTGLTYPLLARHAEQLIGVDVSAEMVAVAREGIRRHGLNHCHVVRADATHLPFASSTFDAVHVWDVLHHLETPKTVCDEIARVLRPGGRLLIFEPNVINPSITWYHARRRSEWRLFTQNQWTMPRQLRSKFRLRVDYDNTIISFRNDRTEPIWRAVDWLTGRPGLKGLSFRYVLDGIRLSDG